jgi:hypothetical protein
MWKIQVTDTFCGEPNFSWVRRYTLPKIYSAKSKLAVVREAKRLAGWSGFRTTTYDYGDAYQINLPAHNQVMFLDWSDRED